MRHSTEKKPESRSGRQKAAVKTSSDRKGRVKAELAAGKQLKSLLCKNEYQDREIRPNVRLGGRERGHARLKCQSAKKRPPVHASKRKARNFGKASSIHR